MLNVFGMESRCPGLRRELAGWEVPREMRFKRGPGAALIDESQPGAARQVVDGSESVCQSVCACLVHVIQARRLVYACPSLHPRSLRRRSFSWMLSASAVGL